MPMHGTGHLVHLIQPQVAWYESITVHHLDFDQGTLKASRKRDANLQAPSQRWPYDLESADGDHRIMMDVDVFCGMLASIIEPHKTATDSARNKETHS